MNRREERRRNPPPKPTLRKLKGVPVWLCRVLPVISTYTPTGYGPTPEVAYTMWRSAMAMMDL